MLEGYRTATIRDLHVGDVVIVECKHFDYKTGRPLEPDYYRTIVGEHQTVTGMAFDLTPDPTFDFPHIPSWQGKPYAGNNNLMQMWIKDNE